MKWNAPLLWLALLVIAGLAIGAWSWFDQGDPTPAIPVTGERNPGQDQPQPPGADAGDVEASERTEVATDTAPDTGERAGQPATDAETSVGSHRVSGRVVDMRGVGIAGARVAAADRTLEAMPLGIGGLDDLMSASGKGVTTNADGGFELRLDAGGAFRLLATHDEHPRGEHRGTATADVQGVVIQLRDGTSIRGRVVGAPDDVQSIVVFSRRKKGVVEGAAAEMLFDLGGLVEGLGIAAGGRRASVDAARQFELRGLDPDERYLIWAANATAAKQMPVKSTLALELRGGSHGAELIWREPLTVSVRVVDAATNAPLERLEVDAGFVKEVKVLGMAVPIPTTRPLPQQDFPDGVVRIVGLEVLDADDPVLAVEVRAAGRRPWIRHDIKVPRAGHVDLGLAALEPAPVVIARVVAAKTGAPLQGAEVELHEIVADADAGTDSQPEAGHGSISFSTRVTTASDADDAGSGVNMLTNATRNRMTGTTDANGECRITAEFGGRAQLRARGDGFARAASDEFDLPARGEQVIDVPLFGGGSVAVTAIDGHGRPAAQVFVRRQGPIDGDTSTERTDAAGQLTFAALSIGEHTFKLLDVEPGDSGPLKVGLSGILDPKAGTTVAVIDGETAQLTLAQPLRGDVTGFLTLGGVPLDGARVRLLGAGGDATGEAIAAELVGSMLGGLIDAGATAKSEVDGLYEMKAVVAGAYRLVVNHEDLAMPSSTEVRIGEGDNRIDVAIAAATLRGRVVSASGAPVPRATVAVMPAEAGLSELTARLGDAKEMFGELFGGGDGSGGVRTAADGTFELRGVRTGTALIVSARARLHQDGSQSVQAIAAGAVRDGVEVVLRPAGRIRVAAVGVRGALTAKVQWAGPPSDAAPKDREGLLRRGRATIDGLRPGLWRVSLDGTGLPDDLQPRTVEVGAGESPKVDFAR